jgi:hypothetical protein
MIGVMREQKTQMIGVMREQKTPTSLSLMIQTLRLRAERKMAKR